MTDIASDRRIPGDWHPGPIPPNVFWGEGVYVERAQIFRLNRSRLPRAIELGNHVSCYAGCSFALGPRGSCAVGDLTLLTTHEEIAEAARAIRADYALHSRAARDLAAEHFEATRVLTSLLARAGI